MRIRSSLILCMLMLVPGMAQAQTAPTEGLRDNSPGIHALTNARIVVAPGNVLENATLVIRDGVIEAVGATIETPPDARIWDMSGRTLYPGFIDPHSSIGMRTEPEEARGPLNWNPQVRSHIDASADYMADEEGSDALRSQGFTVAMTIPQLGIFRGQTSVVSLGDGTIGGRILRSGVAQSVYMARSFQLGQSYPTSAMGAISFVRQTLHDAGWYGAAHAAYGQDPTTRRPDTDAALAALGPAAQGQQPLLFEVRDEEEFLRANRFAEEFPVDIWIRGSGHEYRMLDVISTLDRPLILPVSYPSTPNVTESENSLSQSLGDLRHWYLAPENPGRLASAGMEFSFTTDGLSNRTDFIGNVRKAVERGLDGDAALAALTSNPAGLLGIGRTHGTLERGKVANVVVTDGDLFGDETSIQDVWIDGKRFEVNAPRMLDPRGSWNVVASGAHSLQGELTVEGTPSRLSGTFTVNGSDVNLSSISVTDEARRIRIAFPGEDVGMEGVVRISATLSGEELYGWGEAPDGSPLNWRGERTAAFVAAESAGNGNGNGMSGNGNAAMRTIDVSEVRPAMEYGRSGIPDQPGAIHIRNATVWTMGEQGVMENADVLVRDGRVAQVGQNLQTPSGAVVIDGSGKHVTPGLIDAHLHSGATGGINETGSAIVPEVRIEDVLTIDNIWMYRQLAGGLTTAHVMHGSANPIGGQNEHVKMRWGALPEELKFDGAPRTVKFALGENPKRRSERYPDTRMGTEQIIRDHFMAAREYEAEWAAWESGNQRGIPPRVDLRLDAVRDILNGDILVMSHSYRQDEILMLMRLAEEFDFRIHAFHHGVEAYKVAPELAEHGAGAVVWSDWSSFKIEAFDATLFNARVLNDAGVLTSLHSDDSQIAARMNWEAAKMLRAGMSEVDALSLVTINTAKILGIDERVGSLESDKDADFVVWSGHPLSAFTVAEETWVDGRKYYDIDEDRILRQETERERASIIQLILDQR